MKSPVFQTLKKRMSAGVYTTGRAGAKGDGAERDADVEAVGGAGTGVAVSSPRHPKMVRNYLTSLTPPLPSRTAAGAGVAVSSPRHPKIV